VLAIAFTFLLQSSHAHRINGDRGFPSSSKGSSCLRCSDRNGDFGAPGGTDFDFDMYVMTLSWSASFCEGPSSSSFPGCAAPSPQMRSGFTIHGLWPQYSLNLQNTHGAQYPVCCKRTDTVGSTIDLNTIKSDLSLWNNMKNFWPNERSMDPKRADVPCSIWAHEWLHHGMCTPFNQASYFQAGIKAYQMVPTNWISNYVGRTVQTMDLQNMLENGPLRGMHPVIHCKYNKQTQTSELSEVSVCFDKTATTIMSCAQSGLSGCKDEQITIPAFDAGDDGSGDDSDDGSSSDSTTTTADDSDQ